MNTNNRAGTAGKNKRMPHTIRFRDTEWNRVESLAESRGLTPSEFVRFATLAAVADNHDALDTRLAPLVETTFRAAHILVSKLRQEMLAAGKQDELDAMIAAALALHAELRNKASD